MLNLTGGELNKIVENFIPLKRPPGTPLIILGQNLSESSPGHKETKV